MKCGRSCTKELLALAYAHNETFPQHNGKKLVKPRRDAVKLKMEVWVKVLRKRLNRKAQNLHSSNPPSDNKMKPSPKSTWKMRLRANE